MKKPKQNSLEMVSVKRLRWVATQRYNNEQVRRVAAALEAGEPSQKRLAQAKMILAQAEQHKEDLKKAAEEAQ